MKLILWLQFDTGLYRFSSAKTSVDIHFVPTAVQYITKVGFVAGLIVLTALHLKRRRVSQMYLRNIKYTNIQS